jgi:GTP-binding protein
VSESRLFHVALVGRPNVGKSSLFNALLGYRRTIVANLPGTTLDIVREKVDWGAGPFFLSDTMGVDSENDRENLLKILSQVDAVLFVVDALSGPTPFDRFVGDEVRNSELPTLLVVNKSDAKRSEGEASFGELAVDETLAVSASHRYHLEVLKEWCLEAQRESGMSSSAGPIERPELSVALVGRPNTGKSTLMNRICGTSVSRVSPIAHTTRDSVSFEKMMPQGRVKFVDTAGMRRPRSQKDAIEQFSIAASTRAIETADVVLLLIRCDEEIADQDMRLLSLLERKGRPTVVLLNFWDKLDSKQRKHFLEDSEFAPYLKHFRTLPLSGATGFNVERALELAWKLGRDAKRRVKTAKLNEVVERIIARNPPPAVGARNFNILYASQVSVRPPTFVFFVNRKAALPASYQKYIQHQLMKSLHLKGQPIRLVFRAGKNAKP